MTENKKDDNSSIESQENVEQSDVRVAETSVQLMQREIDKVNELLEKEKQKYGR